MGVPGTAAAQAPPELSGADTAWMLIATALVLLMTPALAFFYGGLVRSKNALNTMMMSFISLGFVGVLWAMFGYSLAFTAGNNWIGDTSRFFLRGVSLEPQGTIPHLLFMAFQGTFAIITAALISGAIVERMRFSAYVVFISLWALFVYSPIAHWVWGGGWLADMGALDFAGGTVVHVNAAVAALVAALVVGKRTEYPSTLAAAAQRAVHAARRRPALVRLVRLQRRQRAFGQRHRRARVRDDDAGAGGDAGGVDLPRRDSSRASRPRSARPPRSSSVWSRSPRPPGFIGPMSAIALGGIAAVPSWLALQWRAKSSLDDSLDVVAAHGVGGTVGALLTGVFAQKALNGLADGALFGNPGQLMMQATAVARRHRLQRRGQLHPAQADLAGAAAPRHRVRRGDRASTSAPTAKRRTCTPMAAAASLSMMKETAPPRRVETLAPATK